MATEKDEAPATQMESVEVNLSEESREANNEEVVVEPIAEVSPEGKPEVAITKSLPSIQQVKVITGKVKKKIEADYKREIDILKSQISEKDAEIARLKEMLEGNS